MKCERCGKALSDMDLYCSRCGKAVFPEYMDEEDIWVYYKSDEELEQILKAEEEQEGEPQPEASEGEDRPAEILEEENGRPEDIEEEEAQPKVFEEEDRGPESSETETSLPEEALIEDFRQEIPAPEALEPEAARSETGAEDPGPGFKPVMSEGYGPETEPEDTEEYGPETEPEDTEGYGPETEPEDIEEPEKPEEQKCLENRDYPEEVSGEEEPASEEASSPALEAVREDTEQNAGEGEEESENEVRSGEIRGMAEEGAGRESDDNGEEDDDEENDEEDDGDGEEDDDDEEEEEPLTPEKKRARRYTALLAGVFLLLCLAAGILLGIWRMDQLDALEKEYDQKIEESQTGASSVKTGNIRLLEEEPDLSQNTKLQPASAQADSQKQSEEEDYSGTRLIDGDQTTSWQEGEEGTGEGKGVTISLDGSHPVRYLALYLGNWKSDELWKYNARPRSLAIQVGEADEEILEFPDEKKVFYLALQEPAEASEIKIRIQSSYEGERWEDNCISEIEVYE